MLWGNSHARRLTWMVELKRKESKTKRNEQQTWNWEKKLWGKMERSFEAKKTRVLSSAERKRKDVRKNDLRKWVKPTNNIINFINIKL